MAKESSTKQFLQPPTSADPRIVPDCSNGKNNIYIVGLMSGYVRPIAVYIILFYGGMIYTEVPVPTYMQSSKASVKDMVEIYPSDLQAAR